MIQLYQITIMYPDQAEMKRIAERLAHDMKKYRIPKNVLKQTGYTGLQDTKEPWLIILCSPDTPKEQEILDAITDYTKRGLYHHILTILVEGTPEESFPDLLLHERLPDGRIVDHEPLAANLTSSTGKQKLKDLKVEKLRLLAPILGVSFDELMNRRRRQIMRIVIALGSTFLLAALAFLGLTVRRIITFQEQNKKLKVQYDRAESARQATQEKADEVAREYASAVAKDAEGVLQSGDCELALLLCGALLPERSDVKELTAVLADALEIRGGEGYVPVTSITENERVSRKADGKNYDLPEEYGMEWSEDVSTEGYKLYVYGETELYVYDPTLKQVVGSMKSFTYPLRADAVAFAGEVSETGTRSADRIVCGDILFLYQEEKTPVPRDLESQLKLAEEFLGNRELTQQEREYYRIES